VKKLKEFFMVQGWMQPRIEFRKVRLALRLTGSKREK